MAVSVRMDPLLESALERAAKRAGVSKSQFIIEAVERALGRKNPFELLLQVEREFAGGSDAPAQAQPRSPVGDEDQLPAEPSHSERLRRVLQAKHDAEVRDWVAFQADRGTTALIASERPAAARRAVKSGASAAAAGKRVGKAK